MGRARRVPQTGVLFLTSLALLLSHWHLLGWGGGCPPRQGPRAVATLSRQSAPAPASLGARALHTQRSRFCLVCMCCRPALSGAALGCGCQSLSCGMGEVGPLPCGFLDLPLPKGLVLPRTSALLAPAPGADEWMDDGCPCGVCVCFQINAYF